MGDSECLPQIGVARGELAEVVTEERGNPRLVVGSPLRHAITECAAHDVGVAHECVDGLAVGPSADVLESLWQFPVVERDVRNDALLEEFIDEAVVEGNTPRFDGPGPIRDDSGPCGGQVVCRDSRVGHERDVLGVPVVVVARDVPGFPIVNAPGFAYESVPGRLALSVLVPGAFDLVRRSRDPEHEVARKRRHDVRSPRAATTRSTSSIVL